MNCADMAVIVTTPEPTAIADAYALIKCVSGRMNGSGGAGAQGLRIADPALEPSRLTLVVNQVTSPEEAAAVHTRIAAVCERFLGLRPSLLGWVSQDARVGQAVRKRRPVMLEHARSPACRDLKELSGALVRALRPVTAAAPGGTGIGGWLKKTILRLS